MNLFDKHPSPQAIHRPKPNEQPQLHGANGHEPTQAFVGFVDAAHPDPAAGFEEDEGGAEEGEEEAAVARMADVRVGT